MKKKQKGIIEIIVVIILAVVLMSLFGINLRAVIESEMLQKNFAYVKDFVSPLWVSYIEPALGYLWSHVFFPYVVTPLKSFFN